tara:strand:+ start:2074 stop:4182 length:2109 start_codon:yes stop_codon:yes gene_type:complete
MARATSTLSTFSSGELDPRMRGRTDLKHYLQGALRMRNFRQLAQGGVSTRPGTDMIAELDGKARIIPFIFSESTSYVLAFTEYNCAVLAGRDWRIVTQFGHRFSLTQVQTMDFAQFADTMILVHEQVRPQVLKRTDMNTFEITDLTFDDNETETRLHQPYFKFTAPEVHLVFGSTSGFAAGTTVAVGTYKNNGQQTVNNFWNADHVGKRFQILDVGDNTFKEFEVLSLSTANTYDASVILKDTLTSQAAQLTLDWGEPLFSDLRGYPNTTCFREGRLWFAGSPGRPSGIIASKVEQFFNFDVGTALDDEAIDFSAATSEVRKIEYLIPGRDLTIFTDGAEMFTSVDDGEAITPTNMNVKPQTFYGCKRVKPYVFDSAILFAQRGNGRNIREYFYKDLNQSYSSSSISILAGHLVNKPVDAAVLTSADFAEQYAFYVMENGSMACFHSIREEETRGWSLWFPGVSDAGEKSDIVGYANSDITMASQNTFMSQLDVFQSASTGDRFISVCVVNDDLFVVSQRSIAGTTRYFLERFNIDRYFDMGITQTSTTPTRTFTGFDDFANHEVAVRSRKAFIGTYKITGAGQLILPESIEPQVMIDVGLPFLAYLKPMPFDAPTRSGDLTGRKRRLNKLIIETFDTLALSARNEVLLTREVTEDLAGQPTGTSGPHEFKFLGYSREPTVTLTLTEPMKATILSMQAELSY